MTTKTPALEETVCCFSCGETFASDEVTHVSGEAECFECHDGAGLALDECGCERCYERAVGRAEDAADAAKEGF